MLNSFGFSVYDSKPVDEVQVEGVDEIGVVFALEIPFERSPALVDLGAAGIDQGVGRPHGKILVPVVLHADRVAEHRTQWERGVTIGRTGGGRGVVAEAGHQQPGLCHYSNSDLRKLDDNFDVL